MKRLLALSVVTTLAIGLVTTSSSAQTPGGWVGTWATSPATGVPNTPNGYPNFSIRNVVHTSIGGASVRVRLSNRFGTKPLQLGTVTVAVAAEPNSPRAVAGSMRTLAFSRSQSVTVPPGAEVLSDATPLRVPEDGDLLVTTYVPTPSGPVTYHPAALQTSFFTRAGNFAAEESGTSYNERTNVWHYVSGVDVQGTPATGSVVTLGDSITDGVGSTGGANRRWPDVLADRLNASQRRLGVPKPPVDLTGLSTLEILRLQEDLVGRNPLTGAVYFGPYVDGKLVRQPVIDAVRAGNARGIDVLTGSNRDEIRYFAQFDPSILQMTLDQYRAFFPPRLNLDDVARVYRNDVLAMLADQAMRVPATRLAEAQSRWARTYLYQFDWGPAVHTAELPFVFGTMSFTGIPGGAEAFQTDPRAAHALSSQMRRAWTSFARTGNPGWPGYRSGRITKVWNTPPSLVFAPGEAERAAWDAFDFRHFQ